MIRGLTLHRPWDVAMLRLGKNIENRKVRPPAAMLGHLIALHSGKVWHADGAAYIEKVTGIKVREADCQAGSIACVGRLVGYKQEAGSWTLWDGAPVPPDTDLERWFGGPVGWVIVERTPIEPAPCRGMQGLFPLPAAVETEVLARYERARRGA